MQAALPLPVLGGLCFCCTVENWFLLIATVARLHQHSELVRVRSTAWEREEYLKATEESSHEKVSWLLPNDHVTLMADQCLTCKEKVCISARNIHFTVKQHSNFHMLSLWYHRSAKCSQKSSYIGGVRISFGQFRPLHQDLVDKRRRESGDKTFLQFFFR